MPNTSGAIVAWSAAGGLTVNNNYAIDARGEKPGAALKESEDRAVTRASVAQSGLMKRS